MYYFYDTADALSGRTVRVVTYIGSSGFATTFLDVETNAGPERAAYQEWLAEGNTPEPYSDLSNTNEEAGEQ